MTKRQRFTHSLCDSVVYSLCRGFARCVLEGSVLPFFKDLVPHLCDRPSSLSKQALRCTCLTAKPFRTVSHASHQWLSPTAAALVEALLVARVASLPALREQWQQQPRWLLPQILPWCVASHTLATSVIRVPSSCFCVSAARCALDRPHQRRYSKLHRDIIKRAWPPALDARAPVQVHCNLRDFLVEILRVQVICSYLRG